MHFELPVAAMRAQFSELILKPELEKKNWAIMGVL